jgi:hypothetical protein
MVIYRRLSVIIAALLVVIFGVVAQSNQSNVATLVDAIAEPEVNNITFSFAQFTDVHISRSNENNTIDLQRAV